MKQFIQENNPAMSSCNELENLIFRLVKDIVCWWWMIGKNFIIMKRKFMKINEKSIECLVRIIIE